MRRVRGDRAFVRLIKRLPDDVSSEMRQQLNATGRYLLAVAQRNVPVYNGPPRKGVVPGALQQALSYSVPPVRLSLKVGLIGKAINRKLFYGHFVEFGTRPHVVWVVPGGLSARVRAAGGRSNSYKGLARRLGEGYQMRIPARPARHFVYVVSRSEIYTPYKAIWERALGKAAAGVSDD